MSLLLLNRTRRQELSIRRRPKVKRRLASRRICEHCSKWVFIRDNVATDRRYIFEFKPVPFVNVELEVTAHNCNKETLE